MDEVYGPESAVRVSQAYRIGQLQAEVFRLQAALAAATERAEAAEAKNARACGCEHDGSGIVAQCDYHAEAHAMEQAANARADALAARLREVADREHPA